MHDEIERIRGAGGAARSLTRSQPDGSGPARHATPDADDAGTSDVQSLDDAFNDLFDRAPVSTKRAFGSRLFGRTADQRRVRLLLIAFGLLTTAIAVFMSSYFRDGERQDRLARDNGRALVEVLQLEHALGRAKGMQTLAPGALEKHRQAIAGAIDSIAQFERPALVDDGLHPTVAALLASWDRAQKTLGEVAGDGGAALEVRRSGAQAVQAASERLGRLQRTSCAMRERRAHVTRSPKRPRLHCGSWICVRCSILACADGFRRCHHDPRPVAVRLD
ncbi:MAG: hypothetical protein R3E87_24075 [Burkholderiaceae bacterium]